MLQRLYPMNKRRSVAAGPTIDVQAGEYTDTVIDPADASASVSFNADGTVTHSSDTGSNYNWRTGGGAGADYEIQFERTSGLPLSSANDNIWHPLSGTVTFENVRTAIGSRSTGGTIRIRLAAAPFTELDSAAVSINAIVESSV